MADDQSETDLIEQISAHYAFEQMILSVLIGSISGGGVVLLIDVAGAFFQGFATASWVSIIMEIFSITFLIFLAGFFSSVVVGAPMFMALERAKRRTVWPYLAAALAIALIISLFVIGGSALVVGFELKAIAATFLPAIVIALTFARRMRPFWRARERAEKGAVDIYRLH